MGNNISKLLDAISGESRQTAEKILADSRELVAEKKMLFEKEAHAAEQSIIDNAEKTAEAIRQRNISLAGIESRNISLTARRKVMREAFDRASETLAALPDQQKKKMYERLITENSTGKEITVQLNENDRKLLGNKIRTEGIRLKIDDQAGDFIGGVIIRAENIETNCTFEAIIERLKEEKEPEVAEILFS